MDRWSDRRFRVGSGEFFVELTDQLVRSVRHTLFLGERDEKTKITRREQWESAGIDPSETDVWDCGVHLLDWFWQIDGTRTAGFSVDPVGALGIEAWARLTATIIEPWEGRILLEMDQARLAGSKEDVATEMGERQGLNVAMFDALFG